VVELKENSQLKYILARKVPLALKGKVERELKRLTANGIIKPVEKSEWTTPIILVLKLSGDVRILENRFERSVFTNAGRGRISGAVKD